MNRLVPCAFGCDETAMTTEPWFDRSMKTNPGLLLLRISQLESLASYCDVLSQQVEIDPNLASELESQKSVYRSSVGFDPEVRHEKEVEVRQEIRRHNAGDAD